LFSKLVLFPETLFMLSLVNLFVLILDYLSFELTDAGALLTFGWGLYGQVKFKVNRDTIFNYCKFIFYLAM